MQFHPTGMLTPEEITGTLVNEVFRGKGGRIFNADGERFMTRYEPATDGADHADALVDVARI